MMRWGAVWSLARSEMRSIVRLVRFWLFAVLATGLGLLAWGYYSVLHGLFSSFSGSVGAISPKFLLSQTAMWQTTLFTIGLVFLAFDVRARDQRDRVVEVLDVRPFSNLELVFGRFLGTLIPAWIPLLLTMLFIQGLGALAETLGWFVGEMVVWDSVYQFLLIEALPAFSFYIGLVYFVSLLTRNRLVSALVSLAVIGVVLWGTMTAPVYLAPSVGINGGFFGTPSELVSQLFSANALLLRGALMLAAIGFLVLSAAVHPRLDDGRRLLSGGAGAALVAAACAVLIGSMVSARGAVDDLDRLEAIHVARLGEPLVDLKSIRGKVTLRSQRQLELDLELAVGARDQPISSALFSFNPGLQIDSIQDSSGATLDFTHDDGLLEIVLPRTLGSSGPDDGDTADRVTGDELTLRLVATGRPDVRFAYLDTAVQWQIQKQSSGGALILLGTESGFYEKNMAVLMPGLAWLPKAGPAVALDDPRRQPTDFFELDLEVEAPDGWTVVGPGKTEGSDGGAKVRLHPQQPLPEVALVAGRFERLATEIAGVRVEVLFNRHHQRNFDFFAEAGPEIVGHVSEILTDARAMGLPYPYETLAVVEVPWTLRSYAGGWRMDTVQAPPGMLLLSEGAFPTSRFEFPFRNPERFEEREGGIARAKLEVAERFFENDFNGGNIFHGAARNAFLYQTAAKGPGALALNALCHELANRLITDKAGYFSAYVFDSGMGWVIGEMMQNLFTGNTGDSVAKTLIRSVTDRPEVWDGALAESLTEMDPWDNPKRSVNVLALKASAIADAILDGAGRQQAAQLLAVLLRDHRGANFTEEDFLAAAAEAGIDLETLVGDFLHQTDLPGFLVSAVRLDRLADDDQGLPQYQTRLFVRNGEPVPGLLRLRYAVGDTGEDFVWESSEPIRVAGNTAVELGLVTAKPPRRMLVSPYLALNRRAFPVTLPPVDEDEILGDPPLRGARPSDWTPELEGEIFVDDLDDTFSVSDEERAGGMRLGGGLSGMFKPPEVLDQGLPALSFGPPPATWSRYEGESNWGRYRRTMAIVAAGDGSRTASFRTRLPQAGRWRIELHLPKPSQGVQREAEVREARVRASFNQGWRFGTYDLSLRDGSGERAIEFDAEAAPAGWNALGDFELGAGDVEVVLSDDTTGTLVAADALRFVRVDGGAVGGAP